MNRSSSSTSSRILAAPRPTSSQTRTSLSQTPAIIPLDYNYQTMSPSSHSQLQREASSVSSYHHRARADRRNDERDVEVDIDDNQYSSLFGDPVPPPPPADFLGSQFDPPHIFRSTSVEISSEEEPFGRTVTVDTHSRLFSDVPYSSTFSRRPSLISARNFDILPTTMPRLEPPHIQILPNSSGGSSSEPHDSPNYTLLAPDDILRKPDLYEISEPADIMELDETITISDANGKREYTESTRRLSNFSDEFKSQIGLMGQPSTADLSNISKSIARQTSNESYSSSEWFRPAPHDFPEFSKMPRMRPSSKNVMSIKRDEMPMHHSPVAAMINDSNGSSSGEERLMNATQTLERPTVSLDALAPERPPDPAPERLREIESDLLLSPQQYLQQRRKSSSDSLGPNYPPPLPAAPPPVPPAPILEETESEEGTSMKRQASPVILRDSVSTGGDYRVEQARLHKKTSFTIISDKSPQSSRAQSPDSYSRRQSLSRTSMSSIQSGKEFTTPSPKSAKPIAKPRYHLQQKSHSSTQLKLPQLAPANQLISDDSPRPSVQFNMTGRYSPSKTPQRGILLQRESLTSSQDTLPPAPRRRNSTLPPSALTDSQRMNSCEALPLITDPYRTAIPRLNRSSQDLRRESASIPPGALPRPLRPNPNPTRKQRGLLKVINTDITSRIPLRSNWSSMDDLTMAQKRRQSLSPLMGPQERRRSSSTSPERRSSTQTASDRRSSNLSTITTSDFSYPRSSITPQPQRRKSIMPSATPKAKRRQSIAPPGSLSTLNVRTLRTKIAKPSTLSPIIGTPNKDSSSPQSPAHGAAMSVAASETPSDMTAQRDSLSRIAVRNGTNSRSNSRMSSRAGSRSGSPLKEFTSQLPLSGLTSRAGSSRSPSRATVRTDSQVNSRAASRSTSRASTRPISRVQSHAGSRPNSRMEQARDIANSRSNSRISVRSAIRAGSVSPNAGRKRGTTPTRRKSISLSPKARRSVARRGSLSPPGKKRSSSRGRDKRTKRDQAEPRRTSLSRIPMRARSGKGATSSPPKSPPKSRVPVVSARKASSPNRDSGRQQRKSPASAKKAPASVRKPESSVKRTPSSVGKQAAAAKKQPSNLQKTGSNLKREPSNLKKKTTAGGDAKTKAVKREPSSVSMKKPGTASSDSKKQMGDKTGAGKASDTKAIATAAVALKALGEAGKAGNTAAVESSTTAAVSGSEAAKTEAAATTAAAATTGTKRHPSNVKLVRMASRMSLLSKRSDSNLSKKLLVPAVTEEMLPNAEASAQDGGGTPKSPLSKVGSSGQLIMTEEAAAIIEKSQKTLETVQKTVTEATHEIHKTINENLTDLKSLENDMGRMSDSAASPTPSVTTVVENKSGKTGESVSRGGTAEGPTEGAAGEKAKNGVSPQPPTQPVEATVSVVNANAVGGDAAERNFELGIDDKQTDAAGVTAASGRGMNAATRDGDSGDDFKADAKRRSPDGQGGSTVDSGANNGSREFLRDQEEEETPPKGCCRCCAKFCMPCRRSRCSRCCRRKKSQIKDESEVPVLSATSSATTTNLEVIDETSNAGKQKTSCWQKLNCCKSCKKRPKDVIEAEQQAVTESLREPSPQTGPMEMGKQQGRCGRCWSKLFCCRSANRVDGGSGDESEVKKCCFCIPCRRKRKVGSADVSTAGGSAAWQDPERGITATDASVLEGGTEVLPKEGCCKRFWGKLLCCRKKPMPPVSESRRASMKANPPPSEDTRRKLHVDLVEYNSKMKGAIPVLPLYLAWFCFLCNVVFPGLGTLFSGLFCICVGIPRFSQYDSAKARVGSLIINIIVGVAQFFCVLFCFVGWGWSIWWGTIMLKCARKLNKIKKVERLELEEEQRQAEAAAAAAAQAARIAANNEPEPAKA